MKPLDYPQCQVVLSRLRRWYAPARRMRNLAILAGYGLTIANTGLGDLVGRFMVLASLALLSANLWFAFASHRVPARSQSALASEAGRWSLLAVIAFLASLPLALIG